MSHWNTVFTSRISRAKLLVLIAGCLASLLNISDGRAAPTTVTPSASPILTSTPNHAKPHPVIVAILKRLGIEQKSSDSITLPPTSAPQTPAAAIKLANVQKDSALQKITSGPSATKKKRESVPPVKTVEQALTAFYSRADQLPLWVSKHGILKPTLKFMDEFAHFEPWLYPGARPPPHG